MNDLERRKKHERVFDSIVFLIGVALIVYGMVSQGYMVAEITLGFIMALLSFTSLTK